MVEYSLRETLILYVTNCFKQTTGILVRPVRTRLGGPCIKMDLVLWTSVKLPDLLLMQNLPSLWVERAIFWRVFNLKTKKTSSIPLRFEPKALCMLGTCDNHYTTESDTVIDTQREEHSHETRHLIGKKILDQRRWIDSGSNPEPCAC